MVFGTSPGVLWSYYNPAINALAQLAVLRVAVIFSRVGYEEASTQVCSGGWDPLRKAWASISIALSTVSDVVTAAAKMPWSTSGLMWVEIPAPTHGSCSHLGRAA